MRAVLATLLAVTVATAPALGQAVPAPASDTLATDRLGLPAAAGASARTPLFSLGGGLATPSGSTAEAYERGFKVGATGVFPVAGRLGIEVGASYVRLGRDKDDALVALGIDPSTFVAGGGFLEGGYRWAGAVTAGLRLLLRPRGRRVVPHVSAGAGYALTGVAEQRLLYLGERETLDGTATTGGPAVSFGAGVEIRVGEGVGVFGAARYLEVFTSPRVSAVVPFTVGLSLRLEEW